MALAVNKRHNQELAIHPDWCKGCSICVEFCPKRVLTLQKGKIAVADPASCLKCGICEKLCPDYAIYFVDSAVEGVPVNA